MRRQHRNDKQHRNVEDAAENSEQSDERPPRVAARKTTQDTGMQPDYIGLTAGQ